MLSDTPFLAPQQAPGQRGRVPRFVRQTPDGEGNRHYAVSYGAIWTWLGAIYFGVFVILAVAGVAQQNPNRPEGSSPTLSVDVLAYWTWTYDPTHIPSVRSGKESRAQTGTCSARFLAVARTAGLRHRREGAKSCHASLTVFVHHHGSPAFPMMLDAQFLAARPSRTHMGRERVARIGADRESRCCGGRLIAFGASRVILLAKSSHQRTDAAEGRDGGRISRRFRLVSDFAISIESAGEPGGDTHSGHIGDGNSSVESASRYRAGCGARNSCRLPSGSWNSYESACVYWH